MSAGMAGLSAAIKNVQRVAANTIAEIMVVSEKTYPNPFMDVTLDAVVIAPDRVSLRVPAFWAGESRWAFRFASDKMGLYTWTLDAAEEYFRGVEGDPGLPAPGAARCMIGQPGQKG